MIASRGPVRLSRDSQFVYFSVVLGCSGKAVIRPADRSSLQIARATGCTQTPSAFWRAGKRGNTTLAQGSPPGRVPQIQLQIHGLRASFHAFFGRTTMKSPTGRHS
jgi:hypothetical protein